MSRLTRVAFALSLLFVLSLGLGCQPADETPSGAEAPAEEVAVDVAAEVERPGGIHDAEVLASTSRLLAGLDTAEDSAPWAEHAPQMETLWDLIAQRHLNAMGTWADEALTAVDDPSLPVFYPFGGPDLPSVQQFFPQASAVVLVGLEPPGSLPILEAIAPEDLTTELERLRSGFENLAEKGYFVAKHMEADFAAPHLDGFLPVLYISLARSGFLPTAVQFFELADDGTSRALDTVTASTARSVKLVYEPAEGEGAPRTLYYFAQDLSNAGLAASPGFGKFVAALGKQNVYMKAAMYLPHSEDFSDLNALVLDQAQTLLQEDSGVPLRWIDQDRFDVTLFGAYDATLPNYREFFQPDLRDAYAEAAPEPLPFEIGYNARIAGSCLIWAERKANGEPVTSP